MRAGEWHVREQENIIIINIITHKRQRDTILFIIIATHQVYERLPAKNQIETDYFKTNLTIHARTHSVKTDTRADTAAVTRNLNFQFFSCFV